ncbi:MAG: TRAP transporter TatT component family protein [Myxococcales bacterium]|nr:TRAP transporter TatT component family protein [Myxococcales bacterium]
METWFARTGVRADLVHSPGAGEETLTGWYFRDYHNRPMGVRGISLGVLLACSLVHSGCNLTGLLIRGQTDGAAEFAEERGTEFADRELVGGVIADGIVTSTGLLYFVEDYEPLLLSAIFGRIAYGVGWLGLRAEELEVEEGKFDEAEKLQKRAGLLYASALRLAKRTLRLRDEGFDAAIAGGLATFKPWVDEHFYRKEDTEVLVVTGLAYFVQMIESEEGLAAAVDLPYGRYLLERSIEIDPTAEDAQALSTIGIVECTVPELMGGRPKLGLKLMQRAMELTERKSHGILVSAAERCAPPLQDRALFRKLLMEVIESGDVPEFRLPNKIARRRAELLLKQTGELFYD